MSRTAKKTDDDIASLDNQIREAEIWLHELNAMWRSIGRPIAVDIARATDTYDPTRRISRLQAGLTVNDQRIELERLKLRRASLLLAEQTDTATTTVLTADRDEARAALNATEEVMRQQQLALHDIQGQIDSRGSRASDLERQIATAEAAIASFTKATERERQELDPLLRYHEYRSAIRGESASAGA